MFRLFNEVSIKMSQTLKENRQMELLYCFYQNKGEAHVFTQDYFNEKVKNQIDMSERLIDHYFSKLLDMGAIKESGIILNDQTSYSITYVAIDLLELIDQKEKEIQKLLTCIKELSE